MSGLVRIAVIADTHIPRRAHDLPGTAWSEIEHADVVVHAGDVTTATFLDRVRERSRRLVAVRGNNDHGLTALPEQVELTLSGVRVAVIHDSGTAAGRRRRLRALFPDARAVIFGHSHIPVVDDDGDLLLLNPGSPTDRRRMATFSMATLLVRSGMIEEARVIDLGLERAPRAQSV